MSRTRLLAFLWYVLLGLAFFGAALFLYRTPLAVGAFPDRLVGDLQAYFGPLTIPWLQAFQLGEEPAQWTDAVFLGMPYLANAQLQAFYPLKLILLAFSVDSLATGFMIIAALHIALAGVGTAALARAFGTSRWAAIIAAMGFAFGGWLLAQDSNLTAMYPATWMPWVVWAAMRARETRRSLGYGLAAALFVALQLLAAGPQIVMTTLLGTGLLLTGLDFFPEESRARLNPVRRVGGTFIWMVMITAFGFALAAVQVLPSLDLAEWTTEGGGHLAGFRDLGARSGADWLLLLSPFALGDLDSFHGSISFAELTIYIGVAPLILVVYGLLARKIDRRAGVLLAVAALFAFLSMGWGVGVYDILSALVPPFPFSGYVAQLFLLSALLLVLVAARVADGIVEEGELAGWPLLVTAALLIATVFGMHFVDVPLRAHVIFAAIAAGALVGISIPVVSPSLKRIAVPALAVILACDLTLQWATFVEAEQRQDTGTFQEGQQVVEALGDGEQQPRVLTLAPHEGAREPVFNAGTLHGYHNLSGFDPHLPQRLQSYALLTSPGSSNPGDDFIDFDEPLHTLVLRTGVEYLIVPQSLPPETFTSQILGNSAIEVVAQGMRSYLLELPNPRPRITLAPTWHHVGSPGEALAALSEHPERFVVETQRFGPVDCLADGEVEIDVWEADFRHVLVESSCPTMLFVMTSYHEGWWAIVNDVPFPVFPGNHAFLAVPVPDGESDVILHFDNPGYFSGLRLTLSALGFIVLVLLFQLWRLLRPTLFPSTERRRGFGRSR